jgi:hypothetical protein
VADRPGDLGGRAAAARRLIVLTRRRGANSRASHSPHVADDRVLAEVHVQRMLDLVGDRALDGEPATVARSVVDPVALHPPTAQPALQAFAQCVRVLPAMGIVLGWRGSPPTDHDPNPIKDLSVDDRLLHDPFRPHPLARFVPPQLGRVAEREILDVDQHLVFALYVPYLVARVPRVDQDRADSELVPRDAAAPPVTGRIVR